MEIQKINKTSDVLEELNRCIEQKEPFSNLRFGDAGLGIIAAFLCPHVLPVGKWSGKRGERTSNNILGQLTIPVGKRERLCKRAVISANGANFIDSYDAYKFIRSRRLGILARSWYEIHKESGITNDSYSSCFIHYFSIVHGEYNLFDIMKGRRIFCITSRVIPLDRLKTMTGAKEINHYRVPRRGRKAGHYREHFGTVMRICRLNARNYDLFLVGAGFLGKIYCDQVRMFGGRAFDAGRLFDFWAGVRKIDSTPKRFISYDPKIMLCRRIKTPSRGNGVW